MIDPDAVRDRWLELQANDARADLERACRAAGSTPSTTTT